MINLFFISDIHFGHDNIIKYANRPFIDVKEMNEVIINNWNEVVKDDDLVIIAGDLSLGIKKPELAQIMLQLKGKKILIKGNHDKFSNSEYYSMGITIVVDSILMKIANKRVNISHYPYKSGKFNYWKYTILHSLFPKRYFRPKEWQNQLENDGKFLIHGHTHSLTKITNRSINVCCEAWDYTPIHINEIIRLINKNS